MQRKSLDSIEYSTIDSSRAMECGNSKLPKAVGLDTSKRSHSSCEYRSSQRSAQSATGATTSNDTVDFAQTAIATGVKSSSTQTGAGGSQLAPSANSRRNSLATHQQPRRNFSASAESKTSDQKADALLQPKRTSPLIRLAMSVDGRARVTSGTTPSPPRIQPSFISQPVPSSLQRSQSAIEQNTALPVLPRRSLTGRSRDARTWEFFCDSNAPDALTEQAQREQSGSAIGPIGLIRSQSNKPMMSNLNKRTANLASCQEAKKQKPATQTRQSKPKLVRAVSSIPRLQNIDGNVQGEVVRPKVKTLKPGSRTTYDFASGDSDKENWEPDTQARPIRRRPRVSNSQSSARPDYRAGLIENQRMLSHSSTLNEYTVQSSSNNSPYLASMSHPAKKAKGRMNRSLDNRRASTPTPAKVDEEVAAFMRAPEGVSREDEDLEGVQNLLSLSQAAWR